MATKVFQWAGVLLLAGVGGCTDQEPSPHVNFVWENRSNHVVVLEFPDYPPDGRHVIETSDRYEMVKLRADPYYYTISTWATTFCLRFDDDPRTVVYKNARLPWVGEVVYSSAYDPRFDPTLDENYRLEEFVNQSGVPSHRWIYTFTDGDFNAALNIWQAEDRE